MAKNRADMIRTAAHWAKQGDRVMTRNLREMAFDRYYTQIDGSDCYYCSRPAESIDHAYPLVAMARVDDPLTIPEEVRVIVPACNECNSLLSAQTFLSMSERKTHLAMARRRIRPSGVAVVADARNPSIDPCAGDVVISQRTGTIRKVVSVDDERGIVVANIFASNGVRRWRGKFGQWREWCFVNKAVPTDNDTGSSEVINMESSR